MFFYSSFAFSLACRSSCLGKRPRSSGGGKVEYTKVLSLASLLRVKFNSKTILLYLHISLLLISLLHISLLHISLLHNSLLHNSLPLISLLHNSLLNVESLTIHHLPMQWYSKSFSCSSSMSKMLRPSMTNGLRMAFLMTPHVGRRNSFHSVSSSMASASSTASYMSRQ